VYRSELNVEPATLVSVASSNGFLLRRLCASFLLSAAAKFSSLQMFFQLVGKCWQICIDSEAVHQ
jgi:hypothetical protein